jgi:hypothetical protein
VGRRHTAIQRFDTTDNKNVGFVTANPTKAVASFPKSSREEPHRIHFHPRPAGFLPAALTVNTHSRSSRELSSSGRRWSFFITGACSRTLIINTHKLSAILKDLVRVSSFLAPRGA